MTIDTTASFRLFPQVAFQLSRAWGKGLATTVLSAGRAHSLIAPERRMPDPVCEPKFRLRLAKPGSCPQSLDALRGSGGGGESLLRSSLATAWRWGSLLQVQAMKPRRTFRTSPRRPRLDSSSTLGHSCLEGCRSALAAEMAPGRAICCSSGHGMPPAVCGPRSGAARYGRRDCLICVNFAPS